MSSFGFTSPLNCTHVAAPSLLLSSRAVFPTGIVVGHLAAFKNADAIDKNNADYSQEMPQTLDEQGKLSISSLRMDVFIGARIARRGC